MAITNYERVGKALELLRDGLRPFVARELESKYGKYWITTVTAAWPNELVWREGEDVPQMDAAVLLRMMWDQWNVVFNRTLGFSERSIVSELREMRNKWAHQEPLLHRRRLPRRSIRRPGCSRPFPRPRRTTSKR